MGSREDECRSDIYVEYLKVSNPSLCWVFFRCCFLKLSLERNQTIRHDEIQVFQNPPVILLMAEILHQFIGSVSPYL